MKENISLKGVYKFTIRDAKSGIVKRIYEYENLIPTVGRALIANNLTQASPDNDPYVNYVALGDVGTAPTNANTTLASETTRKITASATNADNVAYITGFFAADEAVDTHLEAGLFANATATANSGVLVSRVAINITKSNTETLTVDWTLTIN